MTKVRDRIPGVLIAWIALPLAPPGAGQQAQSTTVDPDAARPAESAYFMRPPGPGETYDTWAGAQGPDVGELVLDIARLPSRVDNSQRPEFPPIYEQNSGACGQYTAAASMFTYAMNILSGTTADTDASRFPATFSWNMVNEARNEGSEAYHGWEVAKRLGLPTIETYGTVEYETVGAWPNGYDVWRDAMNHRVAGYRYSPAQTIAQLNEARGWLFDRNKPRKGGAPSPGGLFAMDGRMGPRRVIRKVTKTIQEGQHAAGEDVWIRWSSRGNGHGMTCVGYDDEVGYDVNGDGQITNDLDINGDGAVTLADWERGAYIVANSWGETWSGDGRIYLLYSAMIDETWKRGRYLGRIEVARHTPRMTVRFKLSCDDRTDLRMTVGVARDQTAAKPDHLEQPEAFNGWPVFGDNTHAGHVPMAGPDDDTPLEAGIDLTELLEGAGIGPGEAHRVFLTLDRAGDSEASGELHEAAVRVYNAQGRFEREVPFAIGDGAFGASALEIALTLDT